MKKFLITALVAATGWLAALPAQAAPVLSLVPSTASTTVGGSVTVDIVISGLHSVIPNEIVSGFDLDIFFDPAILSATSLSTVFAPWGTGSDVSVAQDFVAPGHVAFDLLAFPDDATLDALQGDSFILSSITFQGVANGFSNINFGLDLDFERNVVGRDALSLNQVTEGTCVAVGTGTCQLAVPEPTTLPLVLLAMAAGGVVLRRQPLVKALQR